MSQLYRSLQEQVLGREWSLPGSTDNPFYAYPNKAGGFWAAAPIYRRGRMVVNRICIQYL